MSQNEVAESYIELKPSTVDVKRNDVKAFDNVKPSIGAFVDVKPSLVGSVDVKTYGVCSVVSNFVII